MARIIAMVFCYTKLLSNLGCVATQRSESCHPPISDAGAWACPAFRLKPARPRKKPGQAQVRG
jgi:hypothetical protein